MRLSCTLATRPAGPGPRQTPLERRLRNEYNSKRCTAPINLNDKVFDRKDLNTWAEFGSICAECFM